jgi:hypothetical protein
MRIELAELGLPALDALDVDALALPVGPERPLQGLAGYADWRLCGAVSRAIANGAWDPDEGEALLLPSGGRVPAPRVFCFALPSALDAAGLGAAADRICRAMRRAGSTAFASALPPHAPSAAADAARAWLEATVKYAIERQLLLGDPRALHRDLTAAREALGAVVDIPAPVSRVAMPTRPVSLPPYGAVVR